jgi:hypothetical protein
MKRSATNHLEGYTNDSDQDGRRGEQNSRSISHAIFTRKLYPVITSSLSLCPCRSLAEAQPPSSYGGADTSLSSQRVDE